MDMTVSVDIPTGVFKRIGQVGPVYEVGGPMRQLASGDWMVAITLLESGEVTEYRLSSILDDPEAD